MVSKPKGDCYMELKKLNQWLMFDNATTYHGTFFHAFTCTNGIWLKYDILEMNFQISCNMMWFMQYRRRNTEKQVDLLMANVKHNISMEEIFSIPLFKKITMLESDEMKKAEIIEKYVSDNIEVKKALLRKYDAILASKLYKKESDIKITTLREKYASVDEVKNYKEYFTDNDGIFGRPEDDFSGITDIGKCIISVY